MNSSHSRSTRDFPLGKRSHGFTLLEFLLVLALAVPVTVFLVQQAARDAADVKARSVGQEMARVNAAVGAYLQNNYLTLIAVPATTITIAQLQAQALLPATFTGTNVWGLTYNISVLRTGVPGAYNIETLTLLNAPYWANGANVDEITNGVALQTAGSQAGLTTDANTFTALGAAFTETAVNYPNITATGQFGAKNNFASSQFFQFLRRDGTLPMTGPNPLDMGNQNTVNANDIAAQTVTIAAAGDVNFGPRARKLTWLLPRIITMESFDASDGSVIAKPTCDVGGQEQVYLTPINVAGQIYPGDSRPYVRAYVEAVGTTWVARVKGWDLTTSADGTGFASAIARTFCYYP